MLVTSSLCCVSAENMDVSRLIGMVLVTLSFVLLSNQMALDSDGTDFECPLIDNPTKVNFQIVHNITQTIKCVNGRKMVGCCVNRFYCDYNTSSTDLSVYGPPGFRMPCTDVCCPQKYILPIPLPNLSDTTDTSREDDDNSDSDGNY